MILLSHFVSVPHLHRYERFIKWISMCKPCVSKLSGRIEGLHFYLTRDVFCRLHIHVLVAFVIIQVWVQVLLHLLGLWQVLFDVIKLEERLVVGNLLEFEHLLQGLMNFIQALLIWSYYEGSGPVVDHFYLWRDLLYVQANWEKICEGHEVSVTVASVLILDWQGWDILSHHLVEFRLRVCYV